MSLWEYIGYVADEVKHSIYAALLTLVLMALLLAGARMAWGQEDHVLIAEHAWISKYYNAHGTNCCGAQDTFALSHESANALDLGDTIMLPDQYGESEEPVTINRIWPSEDPKGRPWVTRYGCLFRNPGV